MIWGCSAVALVASTVATRRQECTLAIVQPVITIVIVGRGPRSGRGGLIRCSGLALL